MKPTTKEKYEKYVVDVDMAKRLKACGFNAETMFFWVDNPELGTLYLYRIGVDAEYTGPKEFCYLAPTAMELKESYPNEVWIRTQTKSLLRRSGVFHFLKHNGHYVVSLVVRGETELMYEVHREEDYNEANATGRMYAFVFENHLYELHV